MSLDLTDLAAAPWSHSDDILWACATQGSDIVLTAAFSDKRKAKAVAKFAALARNAFDVMMRRGWWPIPRAPGFWNVGFVGVGNCDVGDWNTLGDYCDPFTALVEADAWYKANVESGR